MSKKIRHLFIGVATILVILSIFATWSVYTLFFISPFQITKTAYLYIDRDDNIDSVYQKVIETGNPSDMRAFKFIAEHNDYAKKIKTGKYAIQPQENVRLLERKLRMGYQTPVNITIASVRSLDRVVKSVAKQLMVDSIEIATLLADTAYIRQLGYSKETLPALFIPNTYEVYWNLSPEQFVNRMKLENEKFWNEERLKQADDLGMTPVEVATLASIVEEETAVNAEKPVVAGLYINRLKRGMLLQADPTVKFSLQDFALKRILYKHLEIDSPYNTYKYAGLPPGPIRIPSVNGLESVLNYAKHNYLYMCAKEDFSGTHNFAVTSAQHAANARRYQQALNRRGIR